MSSALSGLPKGVSKSSDLKKPVICKRNQYGSSWNNSEVKHTLYKEIESVSRCITHLNKLNKKENKIHNLQSKVI